MGAAGQILATKDTKPTKKVRLGDVCELNMGQSPASGSYNELSVGLPFYQGNADFGTRTPMPRVWCNAPTKIANAGDILISVRAPIGALNFASERCCIGRGLAALTAKKEADSLFLYFALKTKTDDLNLRGTGSTFKAINKQALSETVIPLPSLPEQKRIAGMLDKICELKKNAVARIEKLDLLVKSRFVEMFGENQAWSKVGLLDVGDCKNGVNFAPNERGYEIHCIGVSNFKPYLFGFYPHRGAWAAMILGNG